MGFNSKIWTPTYQEFQKVFSNDYTLKIMAILSQKRQKLCAADVAKILEIHISTAKKYLDLLFDYQFIERENRPHQPGKPTYYTLKAKQIEITIDIDTIAEEITATASKEALSNPYIREKSELQPRVTYRLNTTGLVEEIIVKQRTKARRIVQQKITLTPDESAFMKYLPHPSAPAEQFLKICEQAQLSNYFTIKGLVPFVDKLKKYDIIEVTDPNPAH